MKIHMTEWAKKIRADENRRAMPIMTYPGMPLIGASLGELLHDPTRQVDCMQALAEEYPTLGLLTIMDLSVEAEAFGAPVAFSDEDVPCVTAPILHDAESIHSLPLPQTGAGRSSVYLETVRLAVEQFHGTKPMERQGGCHSPQVQPIFGGMIGPLSLAVRLRDMTQIMMDLLTEPEIIHVLLEKCAAMLVQYAHAFKAKGANGLIIAEPAAGLLSPEHCEEFSSRYVRRIVESVQDDHFFVILHNCGRATGLVPSLVATGAKGLHFGNAVDMLEVLPQIPETILVFGNIDPSAEFRHGTPASIKRAVASLLEKTAEFRNFVLSSGCDIPPGTPLQNVAAFFEALEDANRENTGADLERAG